MNIQRSNVSARVCREFHNPHGRAVPLIAYVSFSQLSAPSYKVGAHIYMALWSTAFCLHTHDKTGAEGGYCVGEQDNDDHVHVH